jgi:hypothetical protein
MTRVRELFLSILLWSLFGAQTQTGNITFDPDYLIQTSLPLVSVKTTTPLYQRSSLSFLMKIPGLKTSIAGLLLAYCPKDGQRSLIDMMKVSSC